jgi:hypothetical protein
MCKTRIIFLALLMVLSLSLTGCGKKEVLMDVPADDGNYHYSNADLGFSLVLPKEFQYYQTQRKNNSDYTDLEFFVPSSDTGYAQEVPSYAKPVTIRIVTIKMWDAADNIFDKTLAKEIGRKGDTVFSIIFWNTVPKDWREKWSSEMEKAIINNFKML